MAEPSDTRRQEIFHGLQGTQENHRRSFATAHKPHLPQYDAAAKPIWEIAEEIAATVPHSEWAKVPTDLSKNVHHYLHGAAEEE